MRRVHQIESIVVPDKSSRGVDLAENLRFIGSTVTVGISEANDSTSLGITSQRTIPVGTDVQRAIRRSCHKDRVVHGRWSREHCRLEAVCYFHIFQDLRFFGRSERLKGGRAIPFFCVRICKFWLVTKWFTVSVRRPQTVDSFTFDRYLPDAAPTA